MKQETVLHLGLRHNLGDRGITKNIFSIAVAITKQGPKFTTIISPCNFKHVALINNLGMMTY